MNYWNLLLGLLLGINCSAQTTDWQDTYESIEYDDAVARCEALMGEDAKVCETTCYNYCGKNDLKFESEFIYLGSESELDSTKLKFIDNWIKAYFNKSSADLYKHDILFSNNGNHYRIAVQEPTLEYYKDELKKKDRVYLYIMYAGTIVKNNMVEHVFVANDFLKK